MANPKSSNRALTRLLDRTESPAYIVAPDYVLVYANQACADWIGIELPSLLGSKCCYTSQPNGNSIENKTQGLCPSPELTDRTASLQPQTNLVYIVGPDQQKRWRRASFYPFKDADQNHLGVLAICEHVDSTDPTTDPVTCSMEPERLHAALAQIRTLTDQAYDFTSLVGTSPFSNRLRRQARTAIESNVDLMIVGPRGSGKEHLARTIHASRHDRERSELLPFHCSIADQQLVQSNIKDIVSSRSQSRSQSNEQDWLLLLDVDQLGKAAQNEILGFFQLPNFQLRTIATSSQSLIELARNDEFSPDLAYHLSVMTIEIAPLADRKIDIPFLAQAMLEQINVHREPPLAGFTESALRELVEYHWPENLDQLSRTVLAASANACSANIKSKDLPDEFHQALQAVRIGELQETEIDLEQFLAEIERELISRALRQSRNNKSKASKLLGISRPKLLRRIQHFELESSNTSPTVDSQDSDQLDSSAFKELD